MLSNTWVLLVLKFLNATKKKWRSQTTNLSQWDITHYGNEKLNRKSLLCFAMTFCFRQNCIFFCGNTVRVRSCGQFVLVAGQKLQAQTLFLEQNCSWTALHAKPQLEVGRYLQSVEYHSSLCIYFPCIEASSSGFKFFLSMERKEEKNNSKLCIVTLIN